jgi:toxin ParE1/3/4
LKVLLTRIAQRDIDNAAEWYERQRGGLGSEFLDCVEVAIGKIELSPLAYRKVVGENRRCSIERFPYALWFKVEGDVIVVGCLHAKRDPKLAKQRGGVIPF